MVHYKLTYFDVRGYAEPARQIFHLAGVEFEDVRISFENWPELKPKTPFGQVPVLSVDGLEIPQSAAIIRYLAKKFGFSGKNIEEEAFADAIVDQFKDFVPRFREHVLAQREGKPVEEVERIKREITLPAMKTYLGIIEKLLEKSKSGFLVGADLTWADLVVADNITTLVKNGFSDPLDNQRIADFYSKITSIPKLKEWIDKRPDTQF